MIYLEKNRDVIISCKRLIRQELNTLLSIFEQYDLKQEINSLYVSGGIFASLINREAPKDMDIYFSTKSSHDSIVQILKNLTSFIEDVSVNYRDVLGVDGKLITENATTMNRYKCNTKYVPQFITKHVGLPEDVRSTFDFIHCMPYYSYGDDKLYITERQCRSIITKTLEVNNVDSLTESRFLKFRQRGWNTTQAEVQFANMYRNVV